MKLSGRRNKESFPAAMSRIVGVFLSLALLLITAHRLPAPIQEIPESPTPPPEQEATQKSKPRPKSSEVEIPQKSRSRPAPPQARAGPKFAGTWRGTLPFGIAGDLHLKLVVNNEGTAVTESGGLAGTLNLRATNDGRTVTWRSGLLSEIGWTLTPNGDGATAVVTAKSPLVGSPSATFTRGPGSGSITTPQSEIPTAKPDPNSPGFVYNPFDPSATRRLDVRGKKSGTKVKDPMSGKLFIVP